MLFQDDKHRNGKFSLFGLLYKIEYEFCINTYNTNFFHVWILSLLTMSK